MLYSVKTAGTIPALPRVIDTHGLLHVRATKATRACNAADAIDGVTVLGRPTLKLAAAAFGVSVGYVTSALRLPPDQRQAVRRGERPLILPRAPSSIPLRASATEPVPEICTGR
jgi:hypothetical protein